MQTFIPHPNFEKAAAMLDWRRLGKQRVECLQILQALDPDYRPDRSRKGWVNHPAVRMWRGYEGALADYGRAIVREWVKRGYRDIKCGPQIEAYYQRFSFTGSKAPDWVRDPVDRCLWNPEERHVLLPSWWNDERLHRSHQSNLIRKMPEHYQPLFPGVPDDLPYYWPV